MTNPSKLSPIQQAITSQKAKLVNPIKQLPEVNNTEILTKTPLDLPDNIEIIPEATLIPPNELYITMKLPKEVAILHIYQNGEQQYSVWGGNAVDMLSPTKAYPKPNVSLGNFLESKVDPEKVRHHMNRFSYSHENFKIATWLNTLKDKFDDNLCLVIADHTDYEIPWEMLELSPDSCNYEYIGALITTVRWLKEIRSGYNYLHLEVKDDKCCGHTAAYVLDTELKGVGSEIDILEKLKSVIYRSSQHKIKDFQSYLQEEDSSCAFIYIACHGNYEEDCTEMFLGSKLDRTQQLKLDELRKCQLNLIKNSQSIVFINACHSGREQADPFIPDSYRMSFVELFLSKGAKGVIGTLGKVGDTHAAKFASQLIEESLKSSDIPVAELLRQLRMQVVKSLPEEPTPDDLLPFIYTFMYVYYGNPMTVLQLTPQGGQANV
jgi:CHAT domain